MALFKALLMASFTEFLRPLIALFTVAFAAAFAEFTIAVLAFFAMSPTPVPPVPPVLPPVPSVLLPPVPSVLLPPVPSVLLLLPPVPPPVLLLPVPRARCLLYQSVFILVNALCFIIAISCAACKIFSSNSFLVHLHGLLSL